jgi:hypothetical protein
MRINNVLKYIRTDDPMGLICKLIGFATIVFGGITGIIYGGGNIESVLSGMFAGLIISPLFMLVFGIFLAPFVAIYDFLRG